MSQLQVTGEAKIRDIQGPVVANSGVITALDGAANQYVRGDGTLASFPTSGGGGSSVSYYLNGSVNQGTFGGSTYYQMSKNAIVGSGTNFSTSANGLIAQFITDANDPDVVSIPSGNWNVEFFMSVSASSGSLASFYVEIYKYNGSTFTLLATNVATPEQLTNTTTVDAYFTSVAMPLSSMAVTDRLAIRVFANVASKTVTLYTEDNRLCQVVTTFSKGMLSMNNLTDQSQYLTTGTAGTNFAIASTGDTHTFNLPVASATNTGKLSSTDWSTFNNKQNAITNPITGLGASGNVAYFDSASSITSENSFNYDASTNRLGVNTTVPNATIGANAGTDSGYSLLVKNDNANYNGIGFATTSTYGNVIGTEKLGTAPARNLTLLNQSGYISITEVGNLGVNILNPNTGLDIYNGTSAYLWLHTANSGITGTDGVRLALFSNNGANLRNFEGAMSITSEGDFQVITLGAENIRVNSVDGKVGIGAPATVPEMLTVNGSIQQSGVLSSLLKTNGDGKLIAAVAGTDYVIPSALSAYVPTSRTLTINGVGYDLSANRSWTITSDITGSGADGRVAYWNGTNSITSEAGFIYDSSTNRLGVNTSVPNATIGADAALNSGYGLLIKTGASNYNGIGIAIDSTYGNTIEAARLGSAPSRNLTLLNVTGYVSLTETGNFGVGILNPNNGIDIYNSTQSQLWLHNAATGITATDGVRLALFNSKEANLRNFDGGLSITAEGDFSIITIGAENIRVNSANGFVGIGNPATLPSMLTVNGGATITGLTTGQILFPTSGGTLSGSSSLFWDNTNAKLGIGTTTLSSARVSITSTTEAGHLHLVSNAPALTFTNALSITYYAGIGMATVNNNFVTGTVSGDLALGAFNTNNIWFYNNNTNTVRMRLDSDGGGTFSSFVSASGPKSQIRVIGNSVGCGISLSNTIVGANRRNWGIFTEENVEGDFVIKRSTTSGGSANTNVLSLSRDGAATFSSSVGIGKIPFYKFEVVGPDNSTASQDIAGFYCGPTASYNLVIGQDAQDASDYGGSIRDQIIKANNTGLHFLVESNAIRFSTYASATWNQRMTILNNGNVGIGTSSPSALLQLAVANAAVDGTKGVKITNPAGTTVMLECGVSSDSFVGTTSASDFSIRTSNSERFRIASNGRMYNSNPAANDFALTIDGSTTTSQSYGINIYAGTNVNDAALNVNSRSGTNYFKVRGDGAVSVAGSLSKGSGSFKIDHPLESMNKTHDLVHSFVESPQANNIYRGKVQIVDGKAEVNLDEVSTMTEGTFVALNREIHTYTSNETDWDAVRGNVEGNILTIECQNNQSNAMVSWLVIGERKDKHMMDTNWTDDNGRVIVEPLKEIKIIEQEQQEQIEELK